LTRFRLRLNVPLWVFFLKNNAQLYKL